MKRLQVERVETKDDGDADDGDPAKGPDERRDSRGL
jgi:hypothetical protein